MQNPEKKTRKARRMELFPRLTLKRPFFDMVLVNLKSISCFRDLAWFYFICSYYTSAKIIHWLTFYYVTFVPFTLYIFACFVQTDGGIHQVQASGLFFWFYLCTNSLLLFVFAKVKKTRSKIDLILGVDFIYYHRINSTNRALVQLAALGTAGYLASKGDDSLQNVINSRDIAEEVSERARLNLPKMSEARFQMYKDRPSVSKKAIAEMINKYGRGN